MIILSFHKKEVNYLKREKKYNNKKTVFPTLSIHQTIIKF